MNLPGKAVSAIMPLMAACALALPHSAHAQVTVSETLTSAGSLFQYNYVIANNTPDDIFILTLGNLPTGPNAVQNLAFPAGFQATYDPGLNLVSFLPDLGSNSVFGAGTTLGGFSFQSPYLPVGTTFDTLSLTSEITGNVTPEPGAFPLLCGLLGAGLAFRRVSKKRNRAIA